MATGRVVPFPVEKPEHLGAVFVSVSVVRFVFVPVCVRRQVTVSLPEPIVGRHLTLAGQTDPEVTVLSPWVRPRNFVDDLLLFGRVDGSKATFDLPTPFPRHLPRGAITRQLVASLRLEAVDEQRRTFGLRPCHCWPLSLNR